MYHYLHNIRRNKIIVGQNTLEFFQYIKNNVFLTRRFTALYEDFLNDQYGYKYVENTKTYENKSFWERFWHKGQLGKIREQK